MDRGIRPLNVTLLTLLVTATISGVVAFGAGSPGPRAVGRRRAWGVRVGAAAARPGQDPRRAAGPSAARTIAEGDRA